MMGEAVWQAMKPDIFPCSAAEKAAFGAAQTGYLEYFVKLLKGNVFGWEADTVDNENSEGHESQDPISQKTRAPADKERQDLASEEMLEPVDDDFDENCTSMVDIPLAWHTHISTTQLITPTELLPNMRLPFNALGRVPFILVVLTNLRRPTLLAPIKLRHLQISMIHRR